ncbi:hypothetical protein AC1031_012574 [Aphanomyces cochlioides]|nr:hypothetical protein AC1031_012574 [Aphanomyces cochlioides]
MKSRTIFHSPFKMMIQAFAMSWLAATAIAGISGIQRGLPGGTTEGSVEKAKPWLYAALGNATSSFVCVNEIVSVDQQVVAGMHYTYHVRACPVASSDLTVESCAEANCPADKAKPFTVDLYVTAWTGQVDLKSVTPDEEVKVAQVFVGGWKEGSVREASPAFYTAASQETSYENADIPRLCATDILSVRQQVVAGMKYEFHIIGCPVSTAAQAQHGCSCDDAATGYTVNVFHTLSDTYSITNAIADPTLPGGWKLQHIQDADKTRYYQVIDADNTTKTRVCPLNFLSLQTQVVAGTNFRYHISGCPVPPEEKAGGGCLKCQANAAKTYEVTIYEPLSGDSSFTSIVDLTRVSLGMQSHRSIHQTTNNLGLLAVLVSAVVVVSLVLVHKMRTSPYQKLDNVQLSE